MNLRVYVLVMTVGLAPAAALAFDPGLSPLPNLRPNRQFSFIHVPDTQNYSEFYPGIFDAQMNWVVSNQRALNIKFVTHVGDVVNHGDRLNEWNNARRSMNILHNSGIAYGVAAGNHDVTPSGVSGSPFIPQNYLNYFGPRTFAGKSFYRGASPSGLSSYQVWEAGGREFLTLHLSVDTPYAEMVWAQGVLNANRDKPATLTTHRYLQDAEDYTAGVPLVASGRYPDIWYGVEGVYDPSGVRSEELFSRFVRTNKNIFMVNCGHFHEEYRQTSTNIYGLPVHEVLADYQDDPNGGDGWLRVMKFDLDRNRIDTETYSPTLDQYRTADESRFSLSVDFERVAPTTSRTAVFQDGVGGYAGTRDTWIGEAAGNSSFGNSDRLVIDDDVNNSLFSDRRGQGLLRFDQITTTTHEAGKVPMGAQVTEALLRFIVPDDIDTPLFSPRFFVYMMTRAWDENSTWNSLAGGLTAGADFGMLLGSFGGDNDPNGEDLRLLDVTAAVQAWVSGTPNFGFAIIPEIISGNDDGIELWSSEAANILLRPALEVTWSYSDPRLYSGLGGAGINGPLAVPAPGAAGLLLLGAAIPRRRRRA